MKTLLTVRGQSKPQHWSFFFRDRWLSNIVQQCIHIQEECAIHDGTPWTELCWRAIDHGMFVRTETHELTTALKPLHPGTVCLSEGKMSTPNNFSCGSLPMNAQVRSIMQASECKRSLHLNNSSRVFTDKQVTAGYQPFNCLLMC